MNFIKRKKRGGGGINADVGQSCEVRDVNKVGMKGRSGLEVVAAN